MVHSIWNPEPLPRKNCRQPIISPQFSLKLHENEGNWTKRGGVSGVSLESVNGNQQNCSTLDNATTPRTCLRDFNVQVYESVNDFAHRSWVSALPRWNN